MPLPVLTTLTTTRSQVTITLEVEGCAMIASTIRGDDSVKRVFPTSIGQMGKACMILMFVLHVTVLFPEFRIMRQTVKRLVL